MELVTGGITLVLVVINDECNKVEAKKMPT